MDTKWNGCSVGVETGGFRIEPMKGLECFTQHYAPPHGFRRISTFQPEKPLSNLAAKLLAIGMGWRR